MNEDEIIQIVGSQRTYRYGDVKKTVVKIGKEFYRRDSNDLVKIKDRNDKIRFYRRQSPLIVQLNGGEFVLKSECVLTEDNIWLYKFDENVVKIGDKYVRKSFCTKINDQWYLLSDPEIVKSYNQDGWLLKKDAIELNKAWYNRKLGNPAYVHKDSKSLVTLGDGTFILSKDSINSWDFKANKPVLLHYRQLDDVRKTQIVYDFQDKTNPQEDRLLYCPVPTDEAEGNITSIDLNPTASGHVLVFIPTALVQYFTDAIDTYIVPRYLNKLESIKKKINSNFSDLDEFENKTTNFKFIPRPYPGKHEIYRPHGYGKTLRSKSFKMTGGLRYSFGVEFETSQGLLPTTECDKHALFCVGDRSVGAGEYVTSPMQGDAGINALEKICKVLNEHTLVDDRCGIHVHVGTVFQATAKKPEPGIKDAPTFNKNFLMNSINLGALLEEELYSAMPKNRTPTLYHCHSIRRFGGINEKNFDTVLGAYIFGPKELWYSGKDPIKPFDFAPYKLGQQYNANREVGTWAEGRYKWLNLIHSYTRTRHRTIEFRLFSATTVFEKVYAYVLTALAFTYFADNCGSKIKPGVTLSQVFHEAFKGADDIIGFLDAFYDARKKKFNRTNLYPANHPYVKF